MHDVMGRRARLAVVCATLVLVASCRAPYEFNGRVISEPLAAPELAGTNWNGEAFALDALSGRVVVVFFGYTSCPDICPDTLAQMKQLRRRLGARSEGFDVVFVSVDPPRDSVARLAEYVSGFDPEFYGISLGPEALEPVKKAWGVYGQAQDNPSAAPGTYYAVDHTSTLFVVDARGQLRVLYSYGQGIDEMLPDIEFLLDEVEPT